MPKKGETVSEITRERMRKAAGSRESQLLRLGIVSRERYEDATAKGLKWCGTCQNFLPPSNFFKGQTKCSVCSLAMHKVYYEKHKRRLNDYRQASYRKNFETQKPKNRQRILRGYGVTSEWYDAKSAEQNHLCAICNKPESSDRMFAIDHDHSCCSGKKMACERCRRGLLCGPCNLALGRAEAHGWIESAVTYLRRYALK